MTKTQLHRSESDVPLHSVLLLRSPHLNWVGFRTTLLEYADVSLVGDVQQPEAARQIAQTARPTLIITPDSLAGLPIVHLLRELHTVSPSSKIIVIGAEKTLDYTTLDGLRALPTVAYVVWEDLDRDALALCLTVALTTNFLLVSPAVAKVVAAPIRTAALAIRTILTEREQEVFRLAGSGVTCDDIGASLYISRSTVKTHVAHIRQKLELSPREDLGVAYRRLMRG
jgi:DNA-binding NarL/FixJ family response regulator